MISNFLRKLAKFGWFLPGFLMWAAYPPMGERTDILFALAPLMWLTRRADAGTAAKRWFQSGCCFWVATMAWMPAIVKNGGPWPLVVLGWFALSAYMAAYFAAYGYLSAKFWVWARGRNYGWRVVGILLVEPVLWCGLELVRSRFLGGFAWNQLGVVAVNSGFGAPAALGGVYLCSAVVMLINGTIAGIAERVWKPERSGFASLKRFGTLETVGAFAVVWGIYAMAGMVVRDDAEATKLKVAMVQRNFPCVFKEQEENPHEVYGKLLGNVSELKPELVVMSESAMCEFGPVDSPRAVAFASWVSRQAGTLLAGGTRFGDGETFNSAALYNGEEIQTYDKVHLVPFGEFIPGDKLIPALQKLAPVGSCTPGEPKLLSLPTNGTPFGVAICFEDTDSALMRKYAKLGAKFLVFITNDSWFSHSNEAEQHAWQAVARAVETGLPVVRVGNSGVTGTITAGGKPSWLVDGRGRLLTDRSGTMFDRISIGDGAVRTPYVVVGDLPLGITFALLMAAMFLVKYRHNYEQRRTLSV